MIFTACSRPDLTPRATTMPVIPMKMVCQAKRRSGSETSRPKTARASSPEILTNTPPAIRITYATAQPAITL